MSWLVGALAFICLVLLDWAAYSLLSVSYNVFYAVCRLDIFGATEAGAALYDEITARLYTAISIVMVFVFAYKMLTLVVDPEGKEKKATSEMVKKTAIALLTVIVLPTVYRYMAIFQQDVVENGTIAQIILGSWGSNSNKNAGDKVALIMHSAFYHPTGMAISQFYDKDGYVRDYIGADEIPSTTNIETVERYRADLYRWENTEESLAAILHDSELREGLKEDEGETMQYTYVISTVAALAAAWMFLVYSIDIGTRAVKLGALELISPIPVILNIFPPKGQKVFETWFNQIKKTYLELFIRIAVIFLGIQICKMIPIFITMIFEAGIQSGGDAFTQCIATVLLILGVLKFCQEAPDLFKQIFAAGGDLLQGVNLKPGMKSRIEDNKLAMKGYGALAAGTGGMRARAGNAFNKRYDAYQKAHPTNSTLEKGLYGAKAGLSALGEGLRGFGVGLKNGAKNNPTELSSKALKDTMLSGADEARESLIKNKKRNERMAAKNEARAQDMGFAEGLKYVYGDARKDYNRKAAETRKKEKEEFENAILGFDSKKKADDINQLKSMYANMDATSKQYVSEDDIAQLEAARQAVKDSYSAMLASGGSNDTANAYHAAQSNVTAIEERIRNSQADLLNSSIDYREKMTRKMLETTDILKTTDPKLLESVEKYVISQTGDTSFSTTDLLTKLKTGTADASTVLAMQTYSKGLALEMSKQSNLKDLSAKVEKK